jgi:DNA-binding IclR family transcriptional regulator
MLKPRTLYKGIDVIEAVAANQPVDVKRLSQLLKIPLPTMYRYVVALEESSYLARIPENGKYQLGMAFIRLGAVALKSHNFSQKLHPILETIAAKTMESVSFQVRRGINSICLDCVESKNAIRMSLRVGRVSPLYAGAGPRVLLAYQLEEDRRKIIRALTLKKIGPKTLTSRKELEARIMCTLKRGYEISEEELTEGARAIAVPVFDCFGKLVGALSVTGLKYRMGRKRLSEFLAILRDSAKQLSHKITADFALAGG